MIKKLLATSALIAVASVANAGTVSTADTTKLKMTVSGSVAFQAGFYSNKTKDGSGVKTNNHREFQQKTKLRFDVSNKADNGLEYGASIEFRPSKIDAEKKTRADKMFMWMAGNWGRVNLGDEDGAGRELSVWAPNVGMGQIDGDIYDYTPSNGQNWVGFRNWNTSRDTKITYYIPKFMGFEAGVSYTPEMGSHGEEVYMSKFAGASSRGDAILFRDVVELGAKYSNQFNGVDVVVSGAFTAGKAKKIATGSTIPASKNLASWTLGANVGYKGFKVGGGYVHDGKSAQIKALPQKSFGSWNLGATYENGPWGVGVNYMYENLKSGATFNKVKDDRLQTTTQTGKNHLLVGGVNYVVAPGLTVASDLGWFSHKRVATTKENGYVWILQSKVDF